MSRVGTHAGVVVQQVREACRLSREQLAEFAAAVDGGISFTPENVALAESGERTPSSRWLWTVLEVLVVELRKVEVGPIDGQPLCDGADPVQSARPASGRGAVAKVIGTEMASEPAGDARVGITVAEAARRLSQPTWVVYQLCRDGVHPAVQVGRRWSVDAAAVATYISRAKDLR